MTETYDLSLLPLVRQAGTESPEQMSLYVAEAPRHTARGRGTDRLVLYLVMVGNAILSPGKQNQALEHLAKLFYKTPGSATTAMRAVAEELNSLFLKRNQRLIGASRQGFGLMTQLVLRGNQLYLALSGPMHVFMISASETKRFFDAEMTDKSVGQTRFPPLWFCQTTLNPNDTLILAAPPVPPWDEATLSGARGQGPESLRRRLSGQQDFDVNAVIIQARPGKGAIYLPRLKLDAEAGLDGKHLPAEDSLPARVSVEEPEPVIRTPASDRQSVPDLLPVEEVPTSKTPDEIQDLVPQSSLPIAPRQAISSLGGAHPAQAKRTKAGLPDFGRFFGSITKAFAAFGKPFWSGVQRFSKAIKRALLRLLPEEAFKGLPSSVMAFIAIAIPVIVVAVASQAYLSLGREARNQTFYAHALRQAEQADQQTDLLAKRAGWEAALDTLEGVDNSPEVQALRERGIKTLDDLELVRRVNYRQAFQSGLPAEVKVVRIVVSGDDLFLLDGNSGNVIHATETSQGFVIDPTFTCGPTLQGVTISGPLIDIVAWPAGFKPAAAVLAIDSGWNILLCKKNDTPQAVKLAVPTNAVLGSLTGFALDMDVLYVLDPTSNAAWIYWNNQMITEPEEEPYPFFENEIPFLPDVVDLVVNGDDLYLLHADGRLTVCVYSGLKEVPTRCSDPSFIDFRPGSENTPLVPRPLFSHLLYTPPPEPSLYFLEPVSQAIYKFSLRSLGFQRQYQPSSNFGTGAATAFAVDHIRRYLFLAIGQEVLYAPLP